MPRLDLILFLKIAIQLAETLGLLHKNDIVHTDLKPHNIFFNRETGQIKIGGFGVTSILTHEKDDIYDPQVIAESLVYMSPEQTGRMNRVMDYRTDLYSLGVIFYEILTGVVPFMSDDPMEIIHSHMAVNPISSQGMPQTI
jgi:histidine kinase